MPGIPSQISFGKKRFTLLSSFCLAMLILVSSCHLYRFNDRAIPPDVKSIKINLIENRATLVNPLLSPRLTERLTQKIISQTKLSTTNNDNADWIFTGEIRNYAVSTSGISNQEVSSNRLTVSVHIEVYKQKEDKKVEYDVSRNFEFSANLSLQQAEASLADEMVRSLTDDIFNRIFSNW